MRLLVARYEVKARDYVRDRQGRFSHVPGGGGVAVLDRPGHGRHFEFDVRDVIDTTGGEDFDRPAAEAAIRDVFDGTFGGLTVEVDQINFINGQTKVGASVKDADGKTVGTAMRLLTIGEPDDPDGEGLYVRHELLKLNEGVQGDGFARAWNDHMTEWYRASGVERIHLFADLTVGGYAWMRDYDWRDQEAADNVANRMWDVTMPQHVKWMAVLDRLIADDYADEYDRDDDRAAVTWGDSAKPLLAPPVRLSDVTDKAKLQAVRDAMASGVSDAHAILERSLTATFGSADYPTPFEFSRVGWREGMGGRDSMWLGKRNGFYMGEHGWEGVQWLS